MNENFGEQPEHACGGRHVAPTQRGSRESQGRVAVAARGPRERGRACTRGVKVRLRGTTLQAPPAQQLCPRPHPASGPEGRPLGCRATGAAHRPSALGGREIRHPPPGGLEPGKGPEWAGSKGGGALILSPSRLLHFPASLFYHPIFFPITFISS
jgi:hypothetical protein